MKVFPDGTKVYAEMNGQKVPAVLLRSVDYTRTQYHAYLRVAQQNKFSGEWLVSDLAKPISSKKLRKRATHIPELDDIPVEVQR